ncbi:sensor histidine kinase [Methylophaga lonarensis]|uniref:sensor histidine kinase n=1 Tax=Methylophaga lonarensis TaxID=999151 RepID=UPI003D28BADD
MVSQNTVDPTSWRALLIFSYYRLFLAATLFAVFYFNLPPDFLGSLDPAAYATVSQIYLLAGLALTALTHLRWNNFVSLTTLQLLFDIVFLTLLIHASGGLQSGLGSLMVVVVIAGGTLIPGRLAVFTAAIATLAVLFEASYTQIAGEGVTRYSQAGMLGATFFATTLLAQVLSKKMQRTQLIAEERARDVSKLAMLNQHIISRMQTGVLVVDAQGRISMFNQSAGQLLGIGQSQLFNALADAVPALAIQFSQWLNHQPQAFEPFQARPELPEVLARATRLDSGESLIYLDNTSAMAQQAQQLKLASLGRLSASIAHEIRNPLGAISHAGELLNELDAENPQTQKLTAIIQRHSARVNSIIETILQMSRRKSVEPSVVVLLPWLEKLVAEFSEINRLSNEQIQLETEVPLARVWIDEAQLQQVIYNLLENALHYARRNEAGPMIAIKVAADDDEVTLDISDNGPGVSAEAAEHLFEPFYSQRTGGTGLGLYLAKELCQANGARLTYLGEEGTCCFRISFPMHAREYIE